jgi:hypothetical protein
MAIMQKISEAVSYEYKDVYCCSSCRAHTCEPNKFCNNCGEPVTERNDELMVKANPAKRAKKAKRKVCRKNTAPTNFYLLSGIRSWQSPLKVSGQFYDCLQKEASLSKRIYIWANQDGGLDDDPCIENKIVRLTKEEVESYGVFGTRIDKIYV